MDMTFQEAVSARQEELLRRLDSCQPEQKQTALMLLAVYLQSLT